MGVLTQLPEGLTGPKRGPIKTVRRPKTTKPLPIHLVTPFLDGLENSARNCSIRTLHLSARAVNALSARGIHSIGRLIDYARDGIADLDGAAGKTFAEINEALEALSRSVDPSGTVDWLNYAAQRDFVLLPKEFLTKLSSRRFLRIFPDVAKLAVESRYGQRESYVLERYLLRDESERASLEEVGQGLGYTRQGASLLKRRVVRLLMDTIMDDDYSGCWFRFRPVFVAPLRRLSAALGVAQRRALAYSRWERIVAKTLGVTPPELGPLGRLFLAILGYQVVDFKSKRFHPIILPKNRKTPPFRNALEQAERLLRRELSAGTSKEQLFERLRTQDAQVGPTLSEIPTLLESIPGTERTIRGGLYQVRLERPKRLADQLERLLREKGSAMHFRELAAKVSRLRGKARPIKSPIHVGVALSYDPRFKPIARTGLWVLAEWNVETRTIADIAADFLRDSEKPLTEAELYELIGTRRPINRISISTSLRDSGRFCRTGPRTWELRT